MTQHGRSRPAPATATHPSHNFNSILQVMKACRMRVHMSRKHLMANFACHIGECNFNAPYASGIVAHVDQEHRQEEDIHFYDSSHSSWKFFNMSINIQARGMVSCICNYFLDISKTYSIPTQGLAPGRRGDLPLLQGACVLRQPRLQCAGGPLRVSATTFERS